MREEEKENELAKIMIKIHAFQTGYFNFLIFLPVERSAKNDRTTMAKIPAMPKTSIILELL